MPYERGGEASYEHHSTTLAIRQAWYGAGRRGGEEEKDRPKNGSGVNPRFHIMPTFCETEKRNVAKKNGGGMGNPAPCEGPLAWPGRLSF
jgi:hypothetical protein